MVSLAQQCLWKHACFFLWEAATLCIISCSQQGYSESPDLEFEYADTDKWAAELSGKDRPLCSLGAFLPYWSLIKLGVNAILESTSPPS